MGLTDIYNYIIYDNPLSQGVKHIVKTKIGGTEGPNLELARTNVTIIKECPKLAELAAQNGPFVRLAGIFGASAVILGAYGAHKSYPKDKAKELKSIFETANRFHFIHTLALLGLPLSNNPKLSGSLIIIGTVLFSGTCYYHAFTGENKFGHLAPIGGTVLIFAWLSLVF